MRIAFLGNFRVPYTSENHHAKSLEALGHDVIKLQETMATAEEIQSVAKDCDLFVWVHTHGWHTQGIELVLDNLKLRGIPTMTYHLDLWFGLQRQKDMMTDPYWNVDHFFTVDKQMADWLNENTPVKGHYIGAGVFHEETYREQAAKHPPHEVVFVGSKRYHAEWQYRPKLVQWLQDTYGRRFGHYGNDGIQVVRGSALNKLYADAKVVVGDSLCLNFNYPNYWSDRVYETIGRGGFMIHPYIAGMEKHFEDRKHLVFYDFGNFKQLKSLIDYYLEHDDEREAIRQAGFEHVKQNHTYLNRWAEILEELAK